MKFHVATIVGLAFVFSVAHAETGALRPKELSFKTRECVKCHKPTNLESKDKSLNFSGLNRECLTCHIDTHRGQFAEALEANGSSEKITRCQRCHTPGNWFPDLFDHNRDAAFKLEGAHEKAKCYGCHKKIEEQEGSFVWFKPVDKSCESCHAGNNDILKDNRP